MHQKSKIMPAGPSAAAVDDGRMIEGTEGSLASPSSIPRTLESKVET